MEILSKNEADTGDLARKIALNVQGGDIFALSGDLGSGKTTFAKYFAQALGIKEEVTSPTFVIMKQYDFDKDGRELSLVHVDAYRFNQIKDADSIGLTEIINNTKNIFMIEWPEKIWPIIQSRAKLINFEYIDKTKRKISIDFKGKK